MSDKENKSLRRQLSNISPKKFVPDDKLRDAPAILFRKVLRTLKVDNPQIWARYLRDYLDRVVTEADPVKAKNERQTRAGNIKETYFQKFTLTFNKLVEGLSILRMRSCKVILEITDEDGNVHIVSDSFHIVSKEQLKIPLADEPSSTDNTE